MSRPPIVHSPTNRTPVEMSAPGIPTSLPRHAEKLVIERARETVRAFIPADPLSPMGKLQEAVRVLDVLEGKRES